MLNAEKHRDQLLKFIEENHDSLFGLDKNSEPISCAVSRCNNCQFGFKKSKYVEGYSCSAAKIKWLLSEYKEPVKLSRFEHEYLERISNHSKFRYIARDEIGCIFAYENKPRKYSNHWNVIIEGGALARLPLCDDLYQFMSWEDEEPTPIKEVLDNCEVIDGESE